LLVSTANPTVGTMSETPVIHMELTQGQHALIDAADLELARQYRWYAHLRTASRRGKTYTYGFEARARGAGGTTLLHVLLVQPGPGLVVDHINGNTLDCRRSNLRVCTHLQNRQNSNPSRGNTSGFVGVSSHAARAGFRAYLTVGVSQIHVGWFRSAEEAARARDAALYEWAGEYARLNFPRE